MRKLTEAEIEAIAKYTHRIKVDSVFDVYDAENFIDYEEDELIPVEEGLGELFDAVAYPLKHEGLSEKEARLLANLFTEALAISEEQKAWLLEGYPEMKENSPKGGEMYLATLIGGACSVIGQVERTSVTSPMDVFVQPYEQWLKDEGVFEHKKTFASKEEAIRFCVEHPVSHLYDLTA